MCSLRAEGNNDGLHEGAAASTTYRVSSAVLIFILGMGLALTMTGCSHDADGGILVFFHRDACTCPNNDGLQQAVLDVQPSHQKSDYLGVNTPKLQQQQDKATMMPSVSILVIASGQRSSSTFLSHKVLAGLPCHLSLNEILWIQPAQSGDAWAKEGKDLLRPAYHNDPNDLAEFFIKVGQRRCQEMFLSTSLQEQCNNHCWVNYKHFSVHLKDSTNWKHVVLWNALLEQAEAQNTNYDMESSFAMIILERSVHDRWNSFQLAKQTGDWNVNGDADHREKLASAKKTPVSRQYLVQHEQWFQLARSYNRSLNSFGSKPRFPVMGLTFEDVTQRPKNATQEEIVAKLKKFNVDS